MEGRGRHRHHRLSAPRVRGRDPGQTVFKEAAGATHQLPDSSQKTRRGQAESQPSVRGGIASEIVSEMVFPSRLATLAVVFAQETLGAFMAVCV